LAQGWLLSAVQPFQQADQATQQATQYEHQAQAQ
jgi:hypothetical protein